MKVTLFTSNNKRHNYLINLLSGISDELYVIQECGTIFPGIVPGHYQVSSIIKKYFENVNNAQFHLFGNNFSIFLDFSNSPYLISFFFISKKSLL